MREETDAGTEVETEISILQLIVIGYIIIAKSLVTDVESELWTRSEIKSCEITETEFIAQVDWHIDALL